MIHRPDPYCYAGTRVLRNRLGIRDAAALDEAVDAYASVGWVVVRNAPPASLGFEFLEFAHHAMFSHVFDWAGELRSVPLSPAGLDRDYCEPGDVRRRLDDLFGDLSERQFLVGLEPWDFCATLAESWAEISFIHPFRDGNTRTQSLWVSELAHRAGHPLDWGRIDPTHLRDARLASWTGFPMNLADYLHRRLR